jgi:hypothetical protein
MQETKCVYLDCDFVIKECDFPIQVRNIVDKPAQCNCHRVEKWDTVGAVAAAETVAKQNHNKFQHLLPKTRAGSASTVKKATSL